MSMKRRSWLYVFALAIMLGMFVTPVLAEENEAASAGDEMGTSEGKPTVAFHGYMEANLVMRDENGWQYGFMDHQNLVQQRNTLKFDIDVDPKLQSGNFSISKLHMTYRGAYDSIYDLRAQKYADETEKGGDRKSVV
jgi:hypothetical protein